MDINNIRIIHILILFIIICIYIRRITKQNSNIININFEKKNIKIPKKFEKKRRKIPKNLFQIYIGDKLNGHIINNIRKLKKLNPDWTYTLYNNTEIIKFIKQYYKPIVLRCYNMINPEYGPAKADFFRYLLIYKFGGVYLDIKSFCKYPLSDIIKEDDEYILTNNAVTKDHCEFLNYSNGEFQNWQIMGSPGHPFLKHVIIKCINNILNYKYNPNITDTYTVTIGKMGVLLLTGPIMYTQTIIPLLKKYKSRYTIYNDSKKIGLVYNNLPVDHTKIYTKKHYSLCDKPIIIKVDGNSVRT